MKLEVNEEIVPQDFHRGDADVTEVVFLPGVREIGLCAFRECPNLLRVKFARGVRKVGRCAFMMCKRLAAIEIEEGLLEVEKDAFWSCQELQSVKFPQSLSSIAEGAFSRCKNLSVVEGVEGKGVDVGAFEGSPYADAQARIRAEIERAAVIAKIVRLDVADNPTFPNMANILNCFGFKTGSGNSYAEPYGWRHGGYDVELNDGKHISLWFPHVSFDAGGFANIVSNDGLTITEHRVLKQDEDRDNPAESDWSRSAQLLRCGIRTYRATFAHDLSQKDSPNKYRFIGVYEISEIKENVDGYDFILVHNRVSTHFEYLNGMHLPANQILGL